MQTFINLLKPRRHMEFVIYDSLLESIQFEHKNKTRRVEK
jgi:hypothetical protein